MIIKNKICFLVPAKKNSLRLKNKNIKDFKNKPLISHTFDILKKNNYIKHSYVSSDSDQIIKLAKKYKINVISKRPSFLSQSSTETYQVIKYFLSELSKNNLNYEYIAILQPTSPLRKAITLKKACNIFFKNNLDSLISVSDIPFKSKFLVETKTSYISKKNILKFKNDLFFINGAIYIYKIKELLKKQSLFFENNYIYKMPFEESIDIDDISDFNLALKLYSNSKLI